MDYVRWRYFPSSLSMPFPNGFRGLHRCRRIFRHFRLPDFQHHFQRTGKGTFRFVDFYVRRIRRIFPALLLVLAASGVMGWAVLLPDEYAQLGKHIAAGAGFVSNLVLWAEASYFDSAAELKPLLHLWSLGVEEQFYILWPLLAWIAWRVRIGFLWPVVLLAGASFGLCVYRLDGDPVGAFYSPLTRFWELLAGSALAWLTLRNERAECVLDVFGNDVLGRALLSASGILLLACGFVLIDRRSAFPGILALLPVLGAVLLIAAGERAWFNRVVLSNPLLVWIGLISYPYISGIGRYWRSLGLQRECAEP